MTTQTQAIRSIDDWRQAIAIQWQSNQQAVESLQLKTQYEKLVAMMLLPIIPKTRSQLTTLLKIINMLRFSDHLIPRLKTSLYRTSQSPPGIAAIMSEHFDLTSLSGNEQEALDWLLVATNTLATAAAKAPTQAAFSKKILQELRASPHHNSGVRVQAEMISSGQNVTFAGRDVNIVHQHYAGSKTRLKGYLASLRGEWDYPELGSILPGHNRQTLGAIRLHRLYTQVDVWDEDHYKGPDVQRLTQLRFRAIDQDMNNARRPALDAIAAYPRLVITGGPGTGKSALCRFVATCLAYACDPAAEKKDNVNGLEMLGSGWVHGAILPLYVRLRNFCADKSIFPPDPKSAHSKSLMKYLRKSTDRFADELEKYLVESDLSTPGTLLILDGIDEVYCEEDRLILQSIIENWADTYPMCRVLVTSRTYAYRHDANWRLSERFASAELAPYTRDQIQHYIEGWYCQAALLRPSNFGGRDSAEAHTRYLAQDLIKAIKESDSLYPLARQPLMLAMLTLIHEDNRRLPDKRGTLYEQTVELLDRWNIPIPDDKLAEKLKNLNLARVRAALKLTAFCLHKRQLQYQRYPASVQRKDLLDALLAQQKQGDGLGATIEDVLEYLNTRNGILVSDEIDVYRFPHLSIQEYLAASALIEMYDECDMPAHLTAPDEDGWVFPDNLVALLKDDPYRWRNVTLFAGSIVVADKGQDRRWTLIDALLPQEITAQLPDEFVHSVYVASEIWSESWLKPRTRLQKSVRTHLRACLLSIKDDDRLDAPERSNLMQIAQQLNDEIDEIDETPMEAKTQTPQA